MKRYINSSSSENALYYVTCILTGRTDDCNTYYFWRRSPYPRDWRWSTKKEECQTFSKDEAQKIIRKLEIKDRAEGESFRSPVLHCYSLEKVEE